METKKRKLRIKCVRRTIPDYSKRYKIENRKLIEKKEEEKEQKNV